MEREPGSRRSEKLAVQGRLLLGLTLMVASASWFMCCTRGVFEARQRLTLVADNAEGVSIGMDFTFSGFPSGA